MTTAQITEQAKEDVWLTAAPALAPFARRQALEYSIWYMGHLMTFLATGEETAGRFTLIDMVAKKGNGPPRHIHHREDEAFYLLEGEVTIFVGDETIKGTPGTFIFLPRGISHSFNIESEQARTLILITPAGLENWFTEFGEPARELTLPPALGSVYADAEQKMLDAAARYGIEFVPPLA